MASRTQIRLSQLTGSFGNAVGKIRDDEGARATLGAIPATDLSGSLSELASAIKRINGGAAFSSNASGLFSHSSFGLGANGTEFQINDSSGDITFDNTTSDKDIIFTVNDGGSADTEVMRVDGSAASLLMASGKKIELGGTSTHISGDNTDVTIGGTNLNINAGIDTTNQATNLTVIDNNANAFSFDSAGRADILKIDSTDDSEKVVAYALDVTNDLTVNGNLDVNGTTTTIDTVNLSVQDSIIALGVSGSGDYSNVGDRGILFPRGTAGSITAGLWWDNTQFNLAKTLTGPTSASFESVSTSNWAQLRVGNLLPGEDDTYDLGSTSLAWQDLHLEGDVLMTDAGKVETTAGDLTISSAAAQVVIDAETDIQFNANGNNFFFKDDAAELLEFTSMDPGSGALIGVVSASQGNLALVSAAGSGEIHLAQGPFTANSVTFDVVHNASRKVQFKMGTISEARVRLELDDQNAASCVHDLSGSLLLDDGATAGEIRFQEAGSGNNYMGFKAPDSVSNNRVFTLPDGHPASNNSALVSATDGTLSYSVVSGATTKGIYILTASHAATVAFRTSDDNDQHVAASDSITGLSAADTQGVDLDVFVNGQLLLSGTQTAVGAGTADYMIDATADIAFGFALEIDDVVQIFKRG